MKVIEGALIGIGGDIRCFGDIERVVDVATPVDDLASPKLALVTLRNRAIATSSGAFRGFKIAGSRYSHLINPRNGKPVSHVRSVSVIAPSAIDADAAATACSICHPTESLALIDSMEGFACLILDADVHAKEVEVRYRCGSCWGVCVCVLLLVRNEIVEPSPYDLATSRRNAIPTALSVSFERRQFSHLRGSQLQ
jgi:thiamine biosynthesis lipoprotein ApbE